MWPEFDEDSKATFLKDGFKFMVVTDISAYFENIQLPLLRDGLLKIFPNEQKIINLLISFLEFWCPSTAQGRTFHRGIPQGTQISSFLGNLFLLPLDHQMADFCAKEDAKYFRYMDDVRLFTKTYAAARKALLLIDHTVRSLHLNTQSAKTEILAEHPNKEITARLIDTRMDEINFVIEKIKEKKYKLTKNENDIAVKKLYEIAKKEPFSVAETKILKSQRPLKGLTFRTFRRWLTALSLLKESDYLRYLLKEMRRNPDNRLTKKLVTIVRGRPKVQSVASLLAFIKSDLNLFPHQHAEILWAFRYLSKIPQPIIDHCKSIVLDEGAYFYVRSAAALLLSRTILEKAFLDKCRLSFHKTQDANVRIALAILLMQSTGKIAPKTLHVLVYHPNEKIRRVGKLLREVRYDRTEALKRLKFLFSSENDWVLCDNMGILFSMTQSNRKEILNQVIKCATAGSKKSPRIDLRATLVEIAKRATIQLSNIKGTLSKPHVPHAPPGLKAAE